MPPVVDHAAGSTSMAKRTVWEGADIGIELATFEPGAHHPNHADRHSRITLVLKGQFREHASTGSASISAGDILFKSRTVRHEDYFGNEGVSLLSVVFRSDDLCALEQIGLQRLWSVQRSAHHLRSGIVLLEALRANDTLTIQTSVADLLGAEVGSEPKGGGSPSWLNQLKIDLESVGLSEVDVAQRALAAGVHPAHASRLFRRVFSMSITEHAMYHCVRRAIEMLGRKGQSLSDVAVAAGFYDQSHMSRAFARLTGKTPGRYRMLIDHFNTRCENIAG